MTYDPAKLAELLAVCDRINKIRAGEHPEKVYPDADLNMVGEVGRLYQQDCDTAREHFRPLLEELQRVQRRTIQCCFCGEQCESLDALKAHSADCREHPLAEQLQRLNAENERLRNPSAYLIAKHGQGGAR